MTTHGQRISDLEIGQSAVLEKVEHGGSLEARRLRSGGVAFYWRYTQGGRTDRLPIGPYDSAAPPKSLTQTPRGYSVQAALQAARKMAEKNAATPGGVRAERARVDAETVARKREQEALQRYTVAALCGEYVAYLEAAGKVSWSDAQNIFANHLLSPFPDLASKPAAELEKREAVAIVRRATEAGKKTTARKLRAYLRAAYACAVRADSDATLPSSFIAFNVQANPVEGTAAIRGRADKNPLAGAEIRRYWKALQQEEGVIGAALRLQILSGAQRVQQLNRVTDADDAGDVLRLFDRKGNRPEAREHLVPVSKAMRRELAQLPKKGYLLSTDGGATKMHATSLSTWAQEVATRAKIENFQLKRVRSGVETLLAQAGVSKEIRGQLQSHGIGGVQDTHYDAHLYLAEKRKALETLHRLIDRPTAAQRKR